MIMVSYMTIVSHIKYIFIMDFLGFFLFWLTPLLRCICMLVLQVCLCHCASVVHYFGFRVVIGHLWLINLWFILSAQNSAASQMCAAADLNKQAPHACFLPLPWQLVFQPRNQVFFFFMKTPWCVLSYVSAEQLTALGCDRGNAARLPDGKLIKSDTRPSFLQSHWWPPLLPYIHQLYRTA